MKRGRACQWRRWPSMVVRKKSAALGFLLKLNQGALTFGQAMQAVRQCEEARLEDFAKRLGITKSHLCDIEKGRKMVSPARAAKFAELLGYCVEHFVQLSLEDLVREAGLKLTVRVEAA
jgi:DNA-binding XRE family transcriptional regulator